MRKLFCSLVLTILCICYASAQTVSGVVKDDTGEVLPGATVILKGAKNGTVTDLDGKFQLKVKDTENAILRISYIGMKPKDLPLQGKTSGLLIVLESSSKELNEVVAIGYGTAKKRDLTGSVSSVQGEVLTKTPVTNVAEAITGRLAGVSVTTTDGSPDAEILVRVRGGNSITGDNTPLYIVDGFPVNTINDLSPNDIQTIDILKDASSTAIYGAQGANGVVLITTKRPEGGRVTINYNGYYQAKKLSKRLSIMNPYDFVLSNYEFAKFNGSDATNAFTKAYGVYDDFDIYKSKAGHDWQNDLFGGNMASYQHNIGVQGGTDKTKFSVNTTYVKNFGLIPNNNFNRLSTNFKLSQSISARLRFNLNGRFADATTNGSSTSGGTYRVRTARTVSRPPVDGLSENEIIDPSTLDEEDYQNYIESHMSLADMAAQYWSQKKSRTFSFSGGVEWDALKNLTYKLEAGYDYSFDDNKNYYGRYTNQVRYSSDAAGLPYVEWTKSNGARWRIANTLVYKLKFENSKLDALIGQELISYQNMNNYIRAIQFPAELTPEKIFANIGLSYTQGTTVSSTVNPENNMASFFGRINYSLYDRYILTLTLRADGSSQFAPTNRWGYFPAAAAAWRISDEPFMSDIGRSIALSNLKLRLSYGRAGNNRIPSMMYETLYKLSTNKNYAVGNTAVNGYVTMNSQLANPYVKWESTETKNIGLDFGFFDERISGTLEGYLNASDKLLIEHKIVAPGYSTVIENVGRTSNKGVELTINADIIKNKGDKFNLGAGFNIGYNKNNVDYLANGVNYQEYNSNWAGTDLEPYMDYQVKVGQPLGVIMGYVTDGYYTTNDFTAYNSSTKTYTLKDGVAKSTFAGGKIGLRPGTIKFKDISGPNGVPDGVVDQYDKTIIGNALPKITGGFNLNASYKGFDMTVLFNYVWGNQIYNADKLAMASNYRSADTYSNMLNIMRPSNRYSYLDNSGEIVTDLATLAQMNEGANAKQYWSPWSMSTTQAITHSWAIEDGSFLRLQSVTLGYSLPKKLIRKFQCNKFRVYCTLNNLFVLTKYTGYDPEVSTSIRGTSTSGLTPGCDYSSYPRSIGATVGVNVTF